MILNSIFKDTVTVSGDEKFSNCEFSGGSVPKQKHVYGLTLSGAANVNVEDCRFSNKGYSAILVDTTGNVVIDGCDFACTGMYNPIECNAGDNGAATSHVTVMDCVMSGICGNNYINAYHFAENGVLDVSDVKIVGMSKQSECIRVSNKSNVPATINVRNLSYAYDQETQFDEKWTATILFQDYSKDKTQDFTKMKLNISGLTVDGKKVTDKDKLPVGKLITSCDVNLDETPDNVPTVNFTA